MRRLFALLGAIGLVSGAAANSVQREAPFDFGAPANLGAVINSPGFDGGPSISSDGLSLYFTSDRSGGSGGGDLWAASRARPTDPFGAPQNLGPGVNSPANEFAPSIAADGRSLYFDSDRPGSLGASDIWVATRATSGERFGPARNLGAPVNSSSSDGLPNISADGRSLYFSSRRATVAGDMDLWVARRDTDAGRFSGGENLGPTINSSHYDGEPGISADGRYLFFSSDRPGGSGQRDPWVTARTDRAARFGPPRNLGSLVNGPAHDVRPSISADGSTLFFMSDRPGGSGQIDLWQASNRAATRPANRP